MLNKYKILLSAYACEPGKGSEPSVGWNWAIELAKKGHEIWVITRSNNKKNIESCKNIIDSYPNLHFVYFDFPKFLLFWKKGTLGVHLYYLLWQIGILRIAKKLDKKNDFDIIHHVTFVSFHQPSFLYKLNKKFIYGPVAGGEKTPKQLYPSFALKHRLIENFKIFYNKIKRYDYFQNQVFKHSHIIFVTSLDSKNVIPRKYHHKVKVNLAIGINPTNEINIVNRKQSQFKIMFVGRFIYWKGIQIALHAVSKLKHLNITFTIIGKGPYHKHLKDLAKSLEMDNIIWKEWMPQHKMLAELKNSSCFLFPSYHDSGGMVVLESLANAVPVISLDLAGPGYIVTNNCGRLISTKNKNQEEIITDLSIAIQELYKDPLLTKKLSESAVNRADDFKWSKIVANVYNIINESLVK